MSESLPIKRVFLDLGNVLFGLDYARVYRELAELCASTPEAIESAFGEHPIYVDYETGLIDEATFFNQLAELVGIPNQPKALQTIWENLLYPLDANLDFACALAKQYPLGVISNTNTTHIRFAQEHKPLAKAVDLWVCSHELKCMKPALGIYQDAIERSGFEAQECVFIDDKTENVQAAQEAGLRAFRLEPCTCLKTLWESTVDKAQNAN